MRSADWLKAAARSQGITAQSRRATARDAQRESARGEGVLRDDDAQRHGRRLGRDRHPRRHVRRQRLGHRRESRACSGASSAQNRSSSPITARSARAIRSRSRRTVPIRRPRSSPSDAAMHLERLSAVDAVPALRCRSQRGAASLALAGRRRAAARLHGRDDGRDPRHRRRRVRARAAEAQRADGAADDRDLGRPVPRAARHGRRRHDHVRGDRARAATSTSTPSRPASRPRSSRRSRASASRSRRCSATTGSARASRTSTPRRTCSSTSSSTSWPSTTRKRGRA